MTEQFARTQLIFGKEAMQKLASSRVAVFGIGGVGGYTVEALVRSGIGALDLIDNDRVSLSNLNRQIIATLDTVGHYKVDAAEARIHSINPDCRVTKHNVFFLPETKQQFDFQQYDYVVDAIDTVSGKLAIIEEAIACDVPVISSMGAGNKVDPTKLRVDDIYRTSVCPLARVMRHECRKRGIRALKVVYSTEKSIRPVYDGANPPETKGTGAHARPAPGSDAFVPSAAGLIIASEVIRDLTGFNPENRT